MQEVEAEVGVDQKKKKRKKRKKKNNKPQAAAKVNAQSPNSNG